MKKRKPAWFLLFGCLFLLVAMAWSSWSEDPTSFEPKTELAPSLENPKAATLDRANRLTRENSSVSQSKPAEVLETFQVLNGHLKLIGESGVTIKGLWLKIDGDWHFESLPVPGFVDYSVLSGVELIAPAGHIPEKPEYHFSEQKFAAWATLTVRGIPEGWGDSLRITAPGIEQDGTLWRYLSSASSEDDSWSCFVQPFEKDLDNTPASLEEMVFPFTLRYSEGRPIEIEISLKQGSQLSLDLVDALGLIEEVDVYVELDGNDSPGKWELFALESESGDARLPSLTVVNESYGRIKIRVKGKRNQVIKFGNHAIIPRLAVGASVRFFAKATDNSWFSTSSRMIVQGETHVRMVKESGITLEVEGLGEQIGLNREVSIRWWFEDIDSKSVSDFQEYTVRDNQGNLMVRIVPGVDQILPFRSFAFETLRLGIEISNEHRVFGSTLDIPTSRRIYYRVKELIDMSLVLETTMSSSDLNGLRYVTFASAHEDRNSHELCELVFPVNALTPMPGKARSKIMLVDDEHGELLSVLGGEFIPKLAIFECGRKAFFMEKNSANAFQRIPSARIVLDLTTQSLQGEWTVSWGFGCERNQVYPFPKHFTVSNLPARVAFEVPVRHAYLYVNGKRAISLGETSPLTYMLE